MPERRPFSHLHPKTAEFLIAHYHDGANDRFLEAAQNDPKKAAVLAHRLNAMNLYFNLPDTTLKDVGKMLPNGVTHERARQLVQEGIGYLSGFASEEIRATYPADDIPFAKPLPMRSRFFASGDIAKNVAVLSTQGKSAQEIEKYLKSEDKSPGDVRKTLDGWGVDIPFPDQEEIARVRENLIKTLSDPSIPTEDFEKVWGKLTNGQRATLQKQGAVVSLAKLSKSVGLHYKQGNSDPIRGRLIENGVHVKSIFHTLAEGPNKGLVQRYDIVARREVDASIEILRREASLDSFRDSSVIVIVGPEKPVYPNSTQVSDDRNFASVRYILESEGVPIDTRKGVTVSSVLVGTNCPVNIYKLKSNYRVHRHDIRELRIFARQIAAGLRT